MAKIIVVGNFKGGVGKTTAAVNLGFGLIEEGKTVCLVDLDSQGHSSLYVTGNADLQTQTGGSEVLFDPEAELVPTKTESGMDVYHGHRGLGRIDVDSKSKEEITALRPRIESLPYDFVIIDTPPDLATRTVAALLWADLFVLVTTPDPLAQDSTGQVVSVLRGWIKNRWVKPGFRFRILLNMVDRASAEAKAEAEAAREAAPQFVVPTELSYRRDLVKRAVRDRIPVWRVKRLPRDVANAWRSLPKVLDLI